MDEIKWFEDTSYTQEDSMKEVCEELTRRANERLKERGFLFGGEVQEMFFDIIGVDYDHMILDFERGWLDVPGKEFKSES